MVIHGDAEQPLILSVSEPPGTWAGALTNCKTGDDEKRHDMIGSEISRGTDRPLTGSVCVVALNTYPDNNPTTPNTGSDHFTIQLSDGFDDDFKEIHFRVVELINIELDFGNAEDLSPIPTKISKSITGPFVLIEVVIDNLLVFLDDALIEHQTVVYRCADPYFRKGLERTDTIECYDHRQSIGGGEFSGQSETRESRWTVIANVTNTANITVVDTNLEPSKVYHYAARVFVGNMSSDNIPLGNVTTPADGPPVLVLNQPNMTVLLGSPYVDPGYEAIDFYEGNVTDRVRTWTINPVDTSKETSYRIFYYASDSVGNHAPTQVRTVTVVAQDLPPTITFTDGAEITVPASVPYVEPGYDAIDAIDGNVTDSVTVTGLVNTDVLDTYMLQYSALDSAGNIATQNRTVIVADMTPPTITLIGGARIPTPLSVPYVDPGYEAIDNIDGNVTSMVVVTGMVDTNTEGTYILQYDVSDSAGNAAMTQNRTVIVTSDMTPPVITLKGHLRIEVAAGIPYVDPGYTATDDIDGNITERVVVTGLVNTDVLHAYMLHYDVSDSAGNAAITQNRIVSVVDATPPVFTLIGGTYITVPASVPYVDPGYTAIDAIYGNVTHRVAVSGTVNTDALGSYTLLYFADDASGNLADPVRRVVTVADLTPPVITLKGGSELQITKGTTYVEPGYNATDNIDGNITNMVVVTGTVDTSMAGTYTISYDVTDGAGNAAITQNRTITVMGDDTPPTITLKGQQAITIEGHAEYVEPGYTATDDIDGNITDMVIVTGTVNTVVLDTYTLNYDVSDSSGNAAITQNRTITVVDTTPPVITLKGGSELQITKGTTYVEPGYTAIDNIDGNITGLVVVTGSVDASTLGMYTISYEVTDGAGNAATKVLTVTVVLDTVTPVITLSDGSSITLPMGPTFTEPGYMATDNIDGNITSMVNVTGTVNPLIPGTYTVSYAVTDSSGNTGQQTRTVTISPPTDTTQYCNNMTLAQLMTSGKYNIINKMFSSKSNIKGTDGADLIIVGNNGPTIEGRDGDDCIIGGTGNDTILGQSGNDMIFGNDGDDTIRGGPGHDHLWGLGGNDTMHGGENGDTMYGGADADIMYGGPGQDTIRGGAGNDQIWGMGGNDTIYGESGDDMLYAGPGIDTIYGGPGTDTIESGESDTVHDDDSNGEG